MMRAVAIVAVACCAIGAHGATLGAPGALYGQTNVETLARQYLLGVYERGAVVGKPLELVQSYREPAGWTTDVVTLTGRVDGATGTVYALTNRYRASVARSRTNQILYGSYVSTNTNPQSGAQIVATNWPYITAADLQDVDEHVEWLLADYLSPADLPSGESDWCGWIEPDGDTNWSFIRLGWSNVYEQVGGGVLLTNDESLWQWEWTNGCTMTTNHWRERYAVLDLLRYTPAHHPLMVVTQRSWHSTTAKVMQVDSTQKVRFATYSINQDAFQQRTCVEYYGHYHWTPELGTCTRTDFGYTNGCAYPVPSGEAAYPTTGQSVWSNTTACDTGLVSHLVEASSVEMRLYQYYVGNGDASTTEYSQASRVTNVTASADSSGGDIDGYCDSGTGYSLEEGYATNNLSYDYSSWHASTCRLYAGTASVAFGTQTVASGSVSYGKPVVVSIPEVFSWGDMTSFWSFSDSAYAYAESNDITAEITVSVDDSGRGVYDIFSSTLWMHSEGIVDWSEGFLIWSSNTVQ